MRWLGRSIGILGALALLAAGTAGADADRIPRGPHALEVVVTRPHRPPLSNVTVTNPARIRRFASLIDGLTAVGPSALDCAGRADDPVVTFTFRTAPGGRVLARATQIVEPGGGRGSCEPMTLTVDGRPRMPLRGGAKVVRAAQRLLGLRVAR